MKGGKRSATERARTIRVKFFQAEVETCLIDWWSYWSAQQDKYRGLIDKGKESSPRSKYSIVQLTKEVGDTCCEDVVRRETSGQPKIED